MPVIELPTLSAIMAVTNNSTHSLNDFVKLGVSDIRHETMRLISNVSQQGICASLPMVKTVVQGGLRQVLNLSTEVWGMYSKTNSTKYPASGTVKFG